MALMDDDEMLVRSRLTDAAQDAPVFSGLQSRYRARRAPLQLALAGSAASALVAVIAGLAWVTMTGATQDGATEASCQSVLTYQGHRYNGAGDLVRTPRQGNSVGSAVRPGGCGEEERAVEVFAISGVSPTTAVITDEGVWVAKSLASWPSELAALRELVPCHGSGLMQISGTWASYLGPQPKQDYHPITPYVAVLEADQGKSLPLDAWKSVTVRVQVTEATVHASDFGLVKATLGGGARLLATVHCSGSTYVADSLNRAR